MSYCRANGEDSDAYVMKTGPNSWWCCGCPISEEKGFMTNTLQKLRQHLSEHLAAGSKVPQRTFDRIDREIDAG